MTGELAGRTILITGASSGLGRHFALTLARRGAAVAVAARRISLLDPLVEEIVAGGGRALAVAMDVADEASVIAGYDAIAAELGPVDTVVANAGLNPTGSALNIDMAAFDQAMAVNLRGVFLTLREGARRMIANGVADAARGRMVVVSSIGATNVLPGVATYCASKAGALMLGRALAREWARKGINVNVLCPGYVETDLNQAWFDSAAGQRQVAGFPRRRLMRDGDLDAMLALLCSDAAATITGGAFTVDDGQSL